VDEQPTRVLERTTRRQSPSRQGRPEPYGSARPPGREPEFVYRRRRAAAIVVGGVLFLILLIVVITSAAGGGDPAPESTPSDLGVGATPAIKAPSTDRSKPNKKTDATGETTGGTVTPSTPPATGNTGGTTATPVTPAQPQGGGVGQAPPAQPAPAQPQGEGGGAAAPSSP